MALDLTGLPIDNNLLSKVDAPLGAYRESDLTLAQFNAETLGTWMLCNGQSCSGTEYETLTGKANVPDRRGRVSRMKDHAAGQDADGDRSLGANQDQATAKNGLNASTTGSANSAGNHNHGTSSYPYLNGVYQGGNAIQGASWNPSSGREATTSNGAHTHSLSASTSLSGDAETRMKNTCVNVFIKVSHT